MSTPFEVNEQLNGFAQVPYKMAYGTRIEEVEQTSSSRKQVLKAFGYTVCALAVVACLLVATGSQVSTVNVLEEESVQFAVLNAVPAHPAGKAVAHPSAAAHPSHASAASHASASAHASAAHSSAAHSSAAHSSAAHSSAAAVHAPAAGMLRAQHILLSVIISTLISTIAT
jgi:hypothetical protein